MTTKPGRRPQPSAARGPSDAESPRHAVGQLAWTALWEQLAALERSLDDLRDVVDLPALRPRFTRALIVLRHHPGAAVRDVAAALGATHSATSQTLAVLRSLGLVDGELRPKPAWMQGGVRPDGTPESLYPRRREHYLTEAGAGAAERVEEALTARLSALAALFHEVGAPAFAARLDRALCGRTLTDRTWDALPRPETAA